MFHAKKGVTPGCVSGEAFSILLHTNLPTGPKGVVGEKAMNRPGHTVQYETQPCIGSMQTHQGTGILK